MFLVTHMMMMADNETGCCSSFSFSSVTKDNQNAGIAWCMGNPARGTDKIQSSGMKHIKLSDWCRRLTLLSLMLRARYYSRWLPGLLLLLLHRVSPMLLLLLVVALSLAPVVIVVLGVARGRQGRPCHFSRLPIPRGKTGPYATSSTNIRGVMK